jgi:hypothetical protein
MAGEWLKFECSLPEKPETMAITAAMGWDDTDLTVGKLMRLFRWFDQQTLDGNAVGVTPVLLDKVIGVTGFVQAVIAVRWLTVTDTGLTLRNFDRHNGATAKSRAQTATRVANHRAEQKEKQELRDGNAATVTPALAREEKRREKTDTSPDKRPTCQAQKIIDLYHEVLPELPRVRLQTKDRTRALAKAWAWVFTSTKDDHTHRAETPEQALAWFREYFTRARDNDFLMGRTKQSGEHANWRCDLDFLLTDKGMKHVIEKTEVAA